MLHLTVMNGFLDLRRKTRGALCCGDGNLIVAIQVKKFAVKNPVGKNDCS